MKDDSANPNVLIAEGAAAASVEQSEPLPLEAMDPQIDSIQPGGGNVMRMELAWGAVRRWWLRAFRAGYVRHMEQTRQGDENRCPHEVLDPRDVKFYRNQGGYWWKPEDDPFTWRDRLPFARAGLAELLLSVVTCFGGAFVLWRVAADLAHQAAMAEGPLAGSVWPAYLVRTLSLPLLVVGCLIVWFFRDPRRTIPREPGTIVSPADGKVVTIERIPHDEFIGGPAVLVGIFLSIFNVHVNRSPFPARVIGMSYRPGKFLNALKPESVRENERLELRLQSMEHPQYRFRVRQISGAIARRIVCWLRPGDELDVGEKFGMIKLGSRTELILPDVPELTLSVQLGEHVKAGSSVFGVLRGNEARGTHGA